MNAMQMNGPISLSTVGNTLRVLSVLIAFFASHLVSATFSSNVEVSGDNLDLRGEGNFKWFFFDLYDAALYLPSDVESSNVLGSTPKKLILRYNRDVPSEKIVEAGNELLKKNCLPAEFDAILTDLERINLAYESPKKGDTYALSFHPKRNSTILYFNNVEVAEIEGEEFANLYFRIWLGQHPVSERLRDELLQSAS